MKIRFLFITTGICFTAQIFFSIFYSIKIVDLNTNFNQQQEQLRLSKINQQHLQIDLAKLTSLTALKNSPPVLKLSPIKSTIDLTL